MSKISALDLIAFERPNNGDPKLKRRRKLLDKLSEQVRIAEDASYQPMTQKWHTDEEGERKRIEVPKRVKQWWGRDGSGNAVLIVRYGSKPLELAKGKQASKLASEAEVPATLKLIAEAVEAGEFDSIIEQQVGSRIRGKAKSK